MFKSIVFERILRLLPLTAAFMTPLLLFTDSRDQFELPKLTFLAVTGSLALALALLRRGFPRLNPVSTALLVLFVVQAVASLPGISLSWQTSLLGEYENFSGLLALSFYLAWFFALSLVLDERLIEKTAFFACLAAFLSALYALGQHVGYDFVQWKADSVIGNRDFASLGNPNFLAAYLAMCLPLLLFTGGRHANSPCPAPASGGPGPFLFLGLAGFLLLGLGTVKGASLLPSGPPTGVALALGLPLLAFSLVRFGRIASWVGLGATVLVVGLGLVRTGSRGGSLAAVTALAALGLFILLDRGLRSRTTSWFASVPPVLRFGLPTAVGGILILSNPAFLKRLGDTLLHFAENVGTSRLHIWRPALAMFRENPILGTGLDTFKIAFPRYAGADFNRIDGVFVSSRTAHNEILQAAATTGLLGLAAHLAVLVCLVLMMAKAYRNAGPAARWTIAGLAASAAAFLTQGLFSFGVSSINLLWFFLLAAVVSLSRRPQETGNRGVGVRSPASLPAAIAVLLLVPFSVIRFQADVAFNRGNSALDYQKAYASRMTAQDTDVYTRFGVMMNRKAVDLMPLEVKYRLYLALARERRAEAEPARAVAWLEEALADYDRAIRISPANAYYYNNRQRVALSLFDLTRDPARLATAVSAGKTAVELAPTSPFFKLQWAVSLKKAGDAGAAREAIRESFAINDDFTAKALAQLAVGEQDRGDTVLALELLDEAVAGNASSAEAWYTRSLVLDKAGRKKEAQRDLKKAQELVAERNDQLQ